MPGAELNVLVAVAAGLLSFLSPCVLPLLPSYLSFIAGVSFEELQGTGGKILKTSLTHEQESARGTTDAQP